MIATVLLGVSLSGAAAAQPAAHGSIMTADHRVLAGELVGRSVQNKKGEVIGSVVEVLVDPKGGPTDVLVSVGKFLGISDKIVSIPLGQLQIQGTEVSMPNADQERLASMPSFIMQRIERPGETN